MEIGTVQDIFDDPIHPYNSTIDLFDPSIRKRQISMRWLKVVSARKKNRSILWANKLVEVKPGHYAAVIQRLIMDENLLEIRHVKQNIYQRFPEQETMVAVDDLSMQMPCQETPDNYYRRRKRQWKNYSSANGARLFAAVLPGRSLFHGKI